MSDTFLPGNGFDTYEEQDKVLVGLGSGRGCRAAVRILQQQGFAVAGAVVRLSAEDDTVAAAKEAAKALGIQCITLNASELASQLAEEAVSSDLRFPALLAAADRLGIQYIATGHHARVETDAEGVSRICPAADPASDESAAGCRSAAGDAGPADLTAGRVFPRRTGRSGRRAQVLSSALP